MPWLDYGSVGLYVEDIDSVMRTWHLESNVVLCCPALLKNQDTLNCEKSEGGAGVIAIGFSVGPSFEPQIYKRRCGNPSEEGQRQKWLCSVFLDSLKLCNEGKLLSE